MTNRFLSELQTPQVLEAQRRAHGIARPVPAPPDGGTDLLGEDEAGFIAHRDSFYLATVGESGWPHLQHRGGPVGFLKVLSPRQIAFADLRGNRQLISTGNVEATGRVALILMDYPNRTRLKIIGTARVVAAKDDPALVERVAPTAALRKQVERVFVIDVVGFNWNCPAYITPRFSEDEVREHTAPLHQRIAELEAELAQARKARPPAGGGEAAPGDGAR